jgi:hypothetical protein
MAGKGQTRLQVIDAFDHPHGGRILRLRLAAGDPPGVRDLRGRSLTLTGPRGEERTARVAGFPLFGGKVSDTRIRETGRVDVRVEGTNGDLDAVDLSWTVDLSRS